jgi:ankyrin repeat protein
MNIQQLQNEYNRLKGDYNNKLNNLQNLQSQKSNLLNQQQQLQNQQQQQQQYLHKKNQLDSQIQSVKYQLSQHEPQVKTLLSTHANLLNQNIDLKSQITLLQKQIGQSQVIKQIYQEFIANFDNILQEFSSFQGARLDTNAMVVKMLPKQALKNAKTLEKICEKKSNSSFDELIKKIDINLVDNNGMTLLMYAIKHGYWYGVDKIMQDSNIDVTVKDKNGYDALMYISAMPHMKYFKMIANKSTNFNQKSSDNCEYTPLHLLIKNCSQKVYANEINNELKGLDMHFNGTLIVDENLTLGSINMGGRSDGYNINQEKTLRLVKILTNKGANIKLVDKLGYSPLSYALFKGNKYLHNKLDSTYSIDLNNIDPTGFQKLLAGLFLDDTNIINSVLNSKPNVLKLQDKTQMSLLHYMVSTTNIDKIKLLINKGADLNLQEVNGFTPFHLACFRKKKDIAKEIFKHTQDFSKKTITNQDALSMVAELRDTSMIDTLLSKGLNINHQDTNGRTLLYWMTQYKWPDMVKHLITKGANPNINAKTYLTPLQLAVLIRNEELVKIILTSNNLLINSKTSDTADKVTALWYAARDGSDNIIKLLLNKGADINAVAQSSLMSPLCIAMQKKHPETAKLLISKGANVNLVDKSGYNGLIWATTIKDINLFKLFLDKTTNVDIQDKTNGNTPLFWASRGKSLDQMKLLLDKGSKDPANKGGNKAWDVALSNFFYDMTKMLNTKLYKLDQKSLDLWFAAKKGNIDGMKKALESGANIDLTIKDRSDTTPLMQAILSKNTIAVKFLIDKGANVNKIDNKKFSPLYYISEQTGDHVLKIAKLLIDAGADVNKEHKEKLTALDIASALGNIDLMNLLVTSNANINHFADDNWNALHQAFYEGKLKSIQFLLSKGAKIDSKTIKGKTPLHLMLESKKVTKETKKLIINYCKTKIDLSLKDNDGNTIIDIAKIHSKDAYDILSSTLLGDLSMNSLSTSNNSVDSLFELIGNTNSTDSNSVDGGSG